ncbi:hypothetical protein, partial [Microbulbifer sp. 2205BS26-8]|uniref:hypothetical protein n=1 Tax=Microbulbifer sp. 2205BS26-8 TaxID=3064386 RepID=UPI00273D9426
QEAHMRSLTGALMSASPEQRGAIWQGGMQYASDQGWNMEGETTNWDERMLPRLQGRFGIQSKPESKQKREIMQDVNGRKRYVDTGEFVFADVQNQGAANASEGKISPYEKTLQTERAKQQVQMEQKRTENEVTWNTYKTAMDSLSSSMSNVFTGPVFGRLPAVTADAQTADGSVSAMAPILKGVFRQAGEGTFTDQDQALLMGMLPTRKDESEAREAKIHSINTIVRAKLGMPPEMKGADGAGKPPVPGARLAPDNRWYVEKDGVYYEVTG